MRVLAVYVILLIHVMDTSIANVALLSITTDLRMDAYDGHWIVTAFGVGMAGVIPFVPKIVEWLGAATALTVVLATSALSIALCGLGDSFGVLVLSRFLQGASSGGVVLLAQRLMLGYVGPSRRAYGMALWTSAISIAPVLGPFLGAAVIGFLNWRWLFIGQVPLLLAASVFIADEFSLRIQADTTRPDGLPPLLFCSAMLCMEFGLSEALHVGTSGGSLALLCLAAVPTLLFLLRFRLSRSATTLFDWSLLRNSAFRGYIANAAALGAISVSTAIVYTLWLQVQLDLATLDVARVLAAGGLVAGGLTPFIGKIKRRTWFPLLICMGLLCFIESLYLCTRLTVSASLFDLVLPRVLAGLGTALCSPAGYMAISTLDSTRILQANSLGMYLRTMSSSVLVLLSAEGARRVAAFVSELELANGFGTASGHTTDRATLGAVYQTLSRISATEAMHAVCWCGIVAAVLLLANLGLQLGWVRAFGANRAGT